MSEEAKCRCGNPAVDEILVTNKLGAELRIPFCEEHRAAAEEAIAMLHKEGMNEL